MTLTEFLLARFAEDERVAEAARINEHLTERDTIPLRWSRDEAGYARVIATSGRVLAECEAKRRIVGRASLVLESRDLVLSAKPEQAAFPDVNRRECSQARATLRDLALPYADHPDYNPDWRL